MISKGRAWRKAANALARALWSEGLRFQAYQVLREVIKDAQKESK
jgi:hypothetical protein